MSATLYSQRLGMIADEQFQAALERFHLGRFVKAKPISFGMFGQNVFVTSTQGEFVLRGAPHYAWQFQTEQFYAQQLHERTQVPVPWPYLLDSASDIFGWSYIIMPRMPGLQLADPEVQAQIGLEDRLGIARALGENLALMHEATWDFSGRYIAESNLVEPFNLEKESSFLEPEKVHHFLAPLEPTPMSHSQRVQFLIRRLLAKAQTYNNETTAADIVWVEEILSDAVYALNGTFQPVLVMEDYKEENLVVTKGEEGWYVSGVFDFMSMYYGDGEVDLARPVAWYLERGPHLAREFAQAYLLKRPPRPGFEKRFPVYMLLDRAILWEFFQKHGYRWWNEGDTFRDWASSYVAVETLL